CPEGSTVPMVLGQEKSAMATWYYNSGGQNVKVSDVELRDLAASGRLAPTTPGWDAGKAPCWKPGGEIVGLKELFARPGRPNEELVIPEVVVPRERPGWFAEVKVSYYGGHPRFLNEDWGWLRIDEGGMHFLPEERERRRMRIPYHVVVDILVPQ